MATGETVDGMHLGKESLIYCLSDSGTGRDAGRERNGCGCGTTVVA
jgi:hypothetical protein